MASPLLPPLSSSPRKHGYGTLRGTPSLPCDTEPVAATRLSPPASLVSRLCFSYAYPMMADGNRRQLDTDDLWDLSPENTAADADATYRVQFDRCNQSIVRAMVYTYGTSLATCGVAMLFSMACGVFAPAVLHHVVDAFTAAPQLAAADLGIWLAAFFASRFANAFVTAHMNLYLELAAMRLTVALKALLFAKAMRRRARPSSSSSTNNTTSEDAGEGEDGDTDADADAIDLANLFSSDVSNILEAALEINNLWVLPLQVAVVVYMLHDVLGRAAFAGLGVIALSMLASYFIAHYEGVAFEDIMDRKDARMKTIKEVFGAMQIVKLNAWETQFTDKIAVLRAHELAAVARYMYLGAASICVLWASPLFVSMVSFGVYALGMGQSLTAAKVFTAMALFNAIREPLRSLPGVVSQCIQASVSLTRMQTFLSLDEYDTTNVCRDGSTYPDDVVLNIQNGSFGWTKDAALLKNVNLTVQRGDLVVVHGAVGAGKSSLCSALLGEMDKLSGSVFVRGRVAYYSQQPWIQHKSIRDNILFGRAYDEPFYRRVVDACGLASDLEGFVHGDATEIGHKGVNLSGGQKARLCLARACYADADVVLLDSPLAAVDAAVQNEIFSECLCRLLASKTVILVTHAPEIINSEAVNYKLHVVDGVVTGERRDAVGHRSVYATHQALQTVTTGTAKTTNQLGDTATGGLTDTEEREEGRVSKTVFLQYFHAVGGMRVCIFLLLVQTLWQGFQIGSDFWLSHWTGQRNGTYDEAKTAYNMAVYVVLGLGSALMVGVRAVTVSLVGLRACRHLFDAMTRSLLHAPLRFFDANPIGRVINRYGDDVSTVDFSLAFEFGGFLATFFMAACQLAAAVYTVPLLSVFVVPLVYVYVQVATFYLAPSRELSRLWKVSSSPLLSHVTASEEGVTVLRAFGQDHIAHAVAENYLFNDGNSKVWFMLTVTNLWFQVRMQLIGAGLVLVIVSTLVVLRGTLSPGLVGLAFTYALSVDGGLSEVVHAWSWIETSMVSPERLLEYASIPSEGSASLVQFEPSPQWPQRGTIAFENVVFSYKPGAPPVLHDISFTIQHNEKIGIVGRTGAGKSSLTMALFRLYELVSGRICIDGLDIATLSLSSLRSRLSIIPQSPVLFKGPLRAYMDPFDDYTDAAIWTALDKVEMKVLVAGFDGQLAYELSEHGENFSVGERQLLCMARALLTTSRIVMLDEATASIDHATETTLQRMIHRELKDATVLTIAHRLTTVLHADRIMVVSDGRVVELDTPAALMTNETGVFYALAKEGGVLDTM